MAAVEDIKTETKDGEEQKVGKVRKLHVVLGVRDREKQVVEILGLEDIKTEEKDGEDHQPKKEKIDPKSLLFVTSGGHGLKTGDAVKLIKPAEKEAK